MWSLISISTPDSSSEALFDVLPAEKMRFDFRPKLVRLFLGLRLTYFLSEQLKYSLQHILSKKSLAISFFSPLFPFDGAHQ